MASTSTSAEVFYPESDGEPMGETIQHRDATVDLILALQDWFVDDPLAYVSGDEFLYYVEGNPRKVVSPDVWTVHGIDKTIGRPTYKTWLEGGRGPDLVIELTSPSTRRIDLGRKMKIYQDDLKVREYFLFDPLDEYLKPALQGHRLVNGEYRRIDSVAGRLPSEVLGLHLEAEGGFVRLFDPRSGRRLLNRLERLAVEKEARRRSDEALRQAELDRQQSEEALRQAEFDRRQSEEALRQAELDRRQSEASLRQSEASLRQSEEALRQSEEARQKAEAEADRFRQELEALRAQLPPKPE